MELFKSTWLKHYNIFFVLFLENKTGPGHLICHFSFNYFIVFFLLFDKMAVGREDKIKTSVY